MRTLIFALLCLCGASAFAAECTLDRDDLLLRPNRDAGPTEIYLHTYINDIVSINDAAQSFSADLFMRIEWKDDRLVHDNTNPCSVALGDIWWPELQLMNRRTVQNVRDVLPMVLPDGTVTLLLRGFGEFSYKADLSDFPFDVQHLHFDIVSIYDESEISFTYQMERIALAPELSVANFSVSIDGVTEGAEFIGATQREHAKFQVRLRAERRTGFYTWQQLVPLFLVVLMSCIVFWIPREHVPSRIGLAATAMLTLIAYRFAMSSVLPPIAYLTRLDVFMIGASILVFTALATAVAVTYVMDLVDEDLADGINATARVILPLLLLAIAWFAFLT